MKITQEHQDKLEELFAERSRNFHCLDLNEFVQTHKRMTEEGKIKIQKCAATNCFSRLLMGEALSFVCKTIYEYADDSHLTTFYKKLYKKYS